MSSTTLATLTVNSALLEHIEITKIKIVQHALQKTVPIVILRPASPAWMAITKTIVINAKCVMKSARLVSMQIPAIYALLGTSKRLFLWKRVLLMQSSAINVCNVLRNVKLAI